LESFGAEVVGKLMKGFKNNIKHILREKGTSVDTD
jgi:hypothetical protein